MTSLFCQNDVVLTLLLRHVFGGVACLLCLGCLGNIWPCYTGTALYIRSVLVLLSLTLIEARVTVISLRPQICISKLCQIMACRLLGAKPLSEPMSVYCWLDPWKQISFIKIEYILFKKMRSKMSSAKWRPFCLDLDVLSVLNPCRHITYCDKSDLFYDMVILVPGKGELVANRECRPFGHYWDYYSGALSLRQVAATRLKIGYLRIALLGELQTWPHSMTGCRDGIVLAIMMTSSNGSIFRVTGPLWGESTGGFPL